MPECNLTLYSQDINEEPLWQNGLTFHYLLVIISSASTVIAIVLSMYSILTHAMHQSRPSQQKCIIRILFMVPTYGMVSLLSTIFPRRAVYFRVISDFYATVAVSAFFSLLASYIESTLHDQKQYFRSLKPKPWENNFPVPVAILAKCTGGERGPLRTPRSGLTWFNIVSFGVFQYPIVLVLTAIITIATEAKGVFCVTNNSPVFAHIWMTVFDALSATAAGYFLEQFHTQLKDDMLEHKTVLKKWCVKLVLIFSTYQTLIMSVLMASWEPKFISTLIHPSSKTTFLDLTVSLPAAMLCVELAIISIVHIFAFPFDVYDLQKDPEGDLKYVGGTLGWAALMNALNPWDQIKSILRTLRWLIFGRAHRFEDISYRRTDHETFITHTSDSHVPPKVPHEPTGDREEFLRESEEYPIDDFHGDPYMVTEPNVNDQYYDPPSGRPSRHDDEWLSYPGRNTF